MTNMTSSIAVGTARPTEKAQPIGGVRFDWWMIALCAWFLGGLYLDGWAHNHLPDTLESFFTPWHGVFYSGFFAVAIFLVVSLIRNHGRGYAWREALPAGYNLSLVAVVIFVMGGVGDLIWHTLFGIEADVEALLSPTHLMLATGIALIVSGPFRAAWHRAEAEPAPGWAAQWPMIISLAFTFSLLTFMTQFSNPFNYPWAAKGYEADDIFFTHSMGVDSILLQTALMMGLILLALRRWTPPFGSLTVILALNSTLMGTQIDGYELWVIPFATLAGLVGDLLLRQLKPSVAQPGTLRLFAFVMPAILYLSYFVGVILAKGMGWSIHMWTGSIVLAGVVGLFLSYLLVPPAVPADSLHVASLMER